MLVGGALKTLQKIVTFKTQMAISDGGRTQIRELGKFPDGAVLLGGGGGIILRWS